MGKRKVKLNSTTLYILINKKQKIINVFGIIEWARVNPLDSLWFANRIGALGYTGYYWEATDQNALTNTTKIEGKYWDLTNELESLLFVENL